MPNLCIAFLGCSPSGRSRPTVECATARLTLPSKGGSWTLRATLRQGVGAVQAQTTDTEQLEEALCTCSTQGRSEARKMCGDGFRSERRHRAPVAVRGHPWPYPRAETLQDLVISSMICSHTCSMCRCQLPGHLYRLSRNRPRSVPSRPLLPISAAARQLLALGQP